MYKKQKRRKLFYTFIFLPKIWYAQGTCVSNTYKRKQL